MSRKFPLLPEPGATSNEQRARDLHGDGCGRVRHFESDSDDCECFTRHRFDAPLTKAAWQFSSVQRTASWEWCHHSPRRTAALNLPRETLRPPVASLQTRNPARFLRSPPTLRGLDARQRHVPLHRHSGPCPETRIRGNRAPDTRDEEPGPVPTIFPNRAPVGCATTVCPVASTFRALPRNLAQGSVPCIAIHDRPYRHTSRRTACTGGLSAGGDPLARTGSAENAQPAATAC